MSKRPPVVKDIRGLRSLFCTNDWLRRVTVVFLWFSVFLFRQRRLRRQECMNTGASTVMGIGEDVNHSDWMESMRGSLCMCVCVCEIGSCVSVVLRNYSEPCLTNIPLQYPTLFAWRSAKAPKELASTQTKQHFHSSPPPHKFIVMHMRKLSRVHKVIICACKKKENLLSGLWELKYFKLG